MFADVVHSMDIAAAVGTERLREIMAELVDRASAVVQRYGGTVDKFTGDGIMAVFGAPVALEDHAVRACLAALGIQRRPSELAHEVNDRDGMELQLRVGLNSGQVITGEIGSDRNGYTAIGEQVGMAQRMESVAPPGGVMLSASTARLVEGAATLGDAELVQIKGADAPVPARRLLSMADRTLLSGGLSRILWVGAGKCPPSRACWTVPSKAMARWSPWWAHQESARAVWCARWRQWLLGREVEVFSAFCESHASEIPFHVVAQLLRAAIGVRGLDGPAARDASALPGTRTQTPRTCCSSMTCWASPIPRCSCPRSIPMPGGGG